MKVNITTNRLLVASFLSVGLMVVLIAVGVVLGSTITQNTTAKHSSIEDSPLKLMADTASAGKNVSLASARVDEELECLYILDHLNGNLQCWLLNIRNGQIGGIFRTNVLEAMPGVKAGGNLDFVMATGFVDFNNRGDMQPGQSVAYVAEGVSGALVGFGFKYDKASIQRNNVQEGVLEVICKGPIRELQRREQ